MFLAVIGFGSGPPFVKLALQEFYVMDLMVVRFSLAFGLMLIFALIMRADLKIRKIGLTPFLMGLLNPRKGRLKNLLPESQRITLGQQIQSLSTAKQSFYH